jgi:hypothetical protein
LAARTHSYARQRRSNGRATLAVVFGLAGALAIPVAIGVTRKTAGAVPLDAAWAIPIAAIGGIAALICERGARGVAVRGSRLLMTARVLAVTAICLTLSSALAVGIYEFLLWKEAVKGP